jgi:hypothetical protein
MLKIQDRMGMNSWGFTLRATGTGKLLRDRSIRDI